ncbi:hypothetical protein FACS189427_01960 [Planctomycetales bacterium]|nr:hypothetical protein FACS189427_01960 [Planctomycetales bacterium]
MVETILYQFFVFGVPLSVAASLYGLRWREGFWGNAVAVPMTFFSILIAVSWWEPVAALIAGQMAATLYVADFLAVWVLFLVPFALIGEITRLISRVRVKFADPIEKGGNAVSLTLVFALLMGFYYFTLDLSPRGEEANASPPSGDSVQVQMLRILTAGNLSSFFNPHQFDARGDFQKVHFQRRQALLQHRIDKQGSMFYEGSIPPKRN